MTNKITEPINLCKVDDYVPITMFAPALEFEHDMYSIMEVDCEFGHAFFINLNPVAVEMMDMNEIRKVIIEALVVYEEVIGESFEDNVACLQHYLDQTTPVSDAALSTSSNQC